MRSPPAEPVVPVHERLDTVAPGELGLCVAGLGNAQVVEAEIGGKSRLLMPAEERPRARDVGPFREARTPPFVVLGDREELRKVEGECAGGEWFGVIPWLLPIPALGAERASRSHRQT